MSKKFKDLTGQVFGRLTVEKTVGNDKQGSRLWSCKCICGKEKIVSAGHLRSGSIKSCGCLWEEIKHKEKRIDLAGQVFDRLNVVEFAGKDKYGKPLWSCRCICGEEIVVSSNSLRSGSTKSCGCSNGNITHGHTRIKNNNNKRTYTTWCNIIQRCNNPNSSKYEIYGKRGIKVCEMWMKFENFLEDMGEAPPGLSIERINNNKNYEPGNCRWATNKEQSNNRRSNRVIEYNGELHNLTQWSDILDINYGTLKNRLNNWSVERAFTYPVRIGKSNKPIVEKQIV
jgi:hypothetical protein